MNIRTYLIGLAIVFTGTVLFWAGSNNTPEVLATANDPHAGHDHANEKNAAQLEAEAKSLFDDDEHAGCDHAAEGDLDQHKEELEALFAEDEHAGHNHGDENNHARHKEELETLFEEDEHSGHDHAAEKDEHAGHGHASSADGICPGHNVPEVECALCQGSHIGDLRPGQGMKVRLATTEVAAKAGIRLSRPQQVTSADGVDIPGQVAFDRKQFATIAPLAAAVVRQVHVLPGAEVERGEVLAELSMPEISSLKAEYVSALAQQAQAETAYHREQELLEHGISSQLEFQQAEADYRSSKSATERYRQQLLNFGLSAADIKQLAQAEFTSATVSLRAPFRGVVTEAQAAMGETVAAGSSLFTVANLDALWIELSIPESKSYLAQVGSKIQARFDGLPGELYSGQLFQVGASIDERSRSLKALAKVQNQDHRLKVGMFGSVRILSGDEAESLTVPSDAVQNIDGQPFLFIHEEADLFELRRVTIGANQNGMVVISTGLAAYEQVVSAQGFALKSEVLKARLGASCADH